ncbi:MAG: alpha/beta fold hydrolase, partial [Myxococcota bacterium]
MTILLHGFMGSGRNLSSLARRWVELDPSRTLIFPDMTGHGESPPLSKPENLEQIATSVLELADHAVGDEPIPLVGHSMGGRVALKARMMAPERVSAVTL